MAFEIDGDILLKYTPEDGETDVTVPCGVRIIGESAFESCTSLQSITLPQSVVEVHKRAFALCANLCGIKLSDNITVLGNQAFVACSSLRHIELPKGLNTIENACFLKCTALESIDIPEGTETIGSMVFCTCSDLKRLYIPGSVKIIGNAFLSLCFSIEALELGHTQFSVAEKYCHSIRSSLRVIYAPFLPVEELLVPFRNVFNNDMALLAAIGFMEMTLTHRQLSDNIVKSYSDYIRESYQNFYPYLPNNRYIADYLCHKRLIPLNDIDMLIDEALSDVEITALLLNYKNSFSQRSDDGYNLR